MNRSELIVMLTHNDYTIENAVAVFQSCKSSSVKYWGAKEQGVSREELKRLFSAIKAAGKFAVLEVVAYDEAGCLEGAELAVECGCDLLLGTVYFEAVHRLCRENGIKYLPFVGAVSGRPSVLEGSIEEILKNAEQITQKGVDGFDLLGYRYSGDYNALCHAFVKNAAAPVCLAGSINSYDRLREVKEIAPAFFTVGGAFWEHAFGEDFLGEIEAVYRYIND